MRRRRRHRRGRPRLAVGSLVRASVFGASLLGLCSIVVGEPDPLGPTDAGAWTSHPVDAPGDPTTPAGDRPASVDEDGSGIVVPTRSGALDAIERRARPVIITIPMFGVIAPVGAAGVEPSTGQLAIPPDASSVVWYRNGPSPGQDGSAVLAGHVDWNGSQGAFFDLGSLPPGAEISISYDDDTTRRFIVQARRHYPKPELPVQELFASSGPPRLTLVTCGGSFDRSAGHYRDNVVVVATPAG